MSKELAASGQLSAAQLTQIKFRILRGEGYTDDEILTVFDMALSSLRGTEQCVVNPVMSCVCSQGTKSCTVNHGTFADGIEAAAKAVYATRNRRFDDVVYQEAWWDAYDIAEGKIRALTQGQRSKSTVSTSHVTGETQQDAEPADHPTEQDADELLREASIYLIYGLTNKLRERIDAHLSRKEPK